LSQWDDERDVVESSGQCLEVIVAARLHSCHENDATSM
jgi:hypothetical protein